MSQPSNLETCLNSNSNGSYELRTKLTTTYWNAEQTHQLEEGKGWLQDNEKKNASLQVLVLIAAKLKALKLFHLLLKCHF